MSLPGLALRLVSSSLTLLQSLAETALGAVEKACRSLPDWTGGALPEEPEAAPGEPQRHHGGSAIALERDATRRRPSLERVAPPPSTPARPSARATLEPSPTLPRPADRERLVVLASAPGSVFAYWQVSQGRRERVLADLAVPSEETQEVLRVRPLQSASSSAEWRIPVPPRATSRHIDDLPAGCLLEVALGIEAGDRFATLCPVVAVRTPEPLPLPSPARGDAGVDAPVHRELAAPSLRVLPWTGMVTESRVTPPSSAEWSDAEARRRLASSTERRSSS
ncbi:MAG: DUF4912 domain-containing protein [Deltaproteobacteria bacterium]|nr:DUF4912 domain-containing protein [Deltaproteobacteria bacterium]